MYCLTLALENKKESNFRNGVLVFANEMTRRVQRPCNPKPQKEGGDRERETDGEQATKKGVNLVCLRK
jgi:hypothetical protein